MGPPRRRRRQRLRAALRRQPDRKQQVTKLKALVKDADELYLATDEDREGEAIAWHLVRDAQARRSRCAGWSSTRSPRRRSPPPSPTRARSTSNLVDAQETRRILDRLYGYEVCPVLWKKVMPRLSAGRVQSVATRIVVERERERMAFRSRRVLGRRGHLRAGRRRSRATRRRSPRRWSRRRRPRRHRPRLRPGHRPGAEPTSLHLDEAGARGLAARLDGRAVRRCSGVEEKPYRRRPYPPFMTSTLQQEAGRKLRWSAQTVMRIAQRLYENGFITYMRTDSTTLSRDGADRGPGPGPRAVRRRLRAGRAAASTPAR